MNDAAGSPQTFFRRCSNCKKEIAWGAKYSLCSVQSCTKVRAPVQFCSPDCWAVHNEIENHKDAWAVEQTAPKSAEAAAVASSPPKPAASTPPRAAPSSTPPSSAASSVASSAAPLAANDGEPLVVVSRFKEFVREASNGMSTSDQVLEPLSSHVRKLCDQAIESARRNNRKTIMGRDVPKPGPQKADGEVLVVVSRLKEYVRQRSDLRTSDEVPPVISEELRRLAHIAIHSARKEGRKTIMGRDIP